METFMRILIFSDGKAGHLNQSIAFAKLKGCDYDIITLSCALKPLAYLLDFCCISINLFGLHITNKDYKAIVSTGSCTYYATQYFAKKWGIKSIALMFPRGFRLKAFDFIIAQTHDHPPKGNTIIELPINLSFSEPKGYLEKRGKALGIILGGSNRHFLMETDEIKICLDTIFKTYPHHLKYITTSRRTPKAIETLLENYAFDYKLIYSQHPHINPIPDFFVVCDELFISLDSTSMLSEAKANSDATLHIIKLKAKKENTKYHRLAQNILAIEGKFDYTPFLQKVVL